MPFSSTALTTKLIYHICVLGMRIPPITYIIEEVRYVNRLCHKGFEPLTLRLKVECSTTELMAHITNISFHIRDNNNNNCNAYEIIQPYLQFTSFCSPSGCRARESWRSRFSVVQILL